MNLNEQTIRDTEHRAQCRAKRRKEERGVFLLLACILVFCVSIGALSYYVIGYHLAGREYRNLSKQYVIFEDADAYYAMTGRGTAIAAEQIREAQEAGYPTLTIDHMALNALNGDYVGWIYVPGADCSYPIVQAGDNDFYLNRTFEGSNSNTGAIFLDYRDSKIFSGFNSFVYGHNMKNGAMFGNLGNYYADDLYIELYPYFYIYLADGTVMKYQIFSYYLTDGDSDSYDRPVNIEEEQAYLDRIQRKSSVKLEIEENRIDTYVTLSTCAGAAGSGQRFLVHGACVGMY